MFYSFSFFLTNLFCFFSFQRNTWIIPVKWLRSMSRLGERNWHRWLMWFHSKTVFLQHLNGQHTFHAELTSDQNIRNYIRKVKSERKNWNVNQLCLLQIKKMIIKIKSLLLFFHSSSKGFFYLCEVSKAISESFVVKTHRIPHNECLW